MLDLRGKSVLLTGASGFLGTKVSQALLARGCNLHAPTHKDFDLIKSDSCYRAFDTYQPQLVVHAAATVGGIGANAARPGEFFFKNMMMGLNVLETSRLFKVEKLIVIGTICEYPCNTPVPFKEDALFDGFPESTNAPYGFAKKTLLVGGQAYRKQYGLNAVHLLPVNLYGPGDNFDPESSHVIPALIRKFHEAKLEKRDEVVCWGTGKATREFLYVDDCAEAIVLAAEKYDKPEPVNVGAGFEVSIRELSHMISRFIGYKGNVKWDDSKPDGQPRRALDVSRAAHEFGWKAKTIFAEGLMKTIEWYVDNRGGNA